MYARLLLLAALTLAACGDDNPPPPPSSNPKAACDTLDFCKISSSGFSCDTDYASSCAQCINSTSCQGLLDGVCKPQCPGMSFKPK